jgi:hypothetical protein
MKKTILRLLLAFFLVAGNAYASFPVRNAIETVTPTEVIPQPQTSNHSHARVTQKLAKRAVPPSYIRVDEDMIITLLLLLAFGWLAAHRWYKGKPVIWNLLFIVTLGGLGLWYVADLINILTNNF